MNPMLTVSRCARCEWISVSNKTMVQSMYRHSVGNTMKIHRNRNNIEASAPHIVIIFFDSISKAMCMCVWICLFHPISISIKSINVYEGKKTSEKKICVNRHYTKWHYLNRKNCNIKTTLTKISIQLFRFLSNCMYTKYITRERDSKNNGICERVCVWNKYKSDVLESEESIF